MRDFWKDFLLSTTAGLGLVANALPAQSGSIGSGSAMGSSSSIGTSSGPLAPGYSTSSAFDSSLDSRSSVLDPRSTLSGTARLESRFDDGLLDANSSPTGSIYRDGTLDPFRDRDLANLNATRFYVNPLGSPYANGNANANER